MAQDDNDGVSVILWQLQQYQHIIRKWDSSLDPYEFKVVMQVLDRTIGWQRLEATFRPHVMLNGDRLYSGFGRTMHRSKLMKVLAQLERRGILRRDPDEIRRGLKSYSINLDWQPEADGAERDHDTLHETVSTGDQVVSNCDLGGSKGDDEVSDGDPRETYHENTIVTGIENTISVDPRPSASGQRIIEKCKTDSSPGHNSEINPPRRQRRLR